MTSSSDQLGSVLREFYAVFGMPNEGPPPNVDVTSLIGLDSVQADDISSLRSAVNDQSLRRQFGVCREILDDLAMRLASKELLRELSTLPVSDRDFEQLSSSIFWFSLAATLDQRRDGLPATPLDKQIDLPLAVKIRMVVQGSLVMRLYLSLVYMREGVLSDLIAQGAQAANPCCGRVRKLLDSDYVRRIRNALSHGSFSSSVAGIAFRDDKGVIIAAPGFLNWMCTMLMLIQVQALAAGVREEEVA